MAERVIEKIDTGYHDWGCGWLSGYGPCCCGAVKEIMVLVADVVESIEMKGNISQQPVGVDKPE